MQNFLFITNRIEHIESKESIDSITHNKNKIFNAFVRIFRDKNRISSETHLKSQTRKNLTLRKSKIYEFDEHTICSMNIQQI